MVTRKKLPLELLDENKGQIEGLPSNPREITQDKFDLLKENIREYPELINYNILKVFPVGDRYVVIGGNMRLRALRELGVEEAVCCVLDGSTDVEDLKAYTILDNASFGQWDWDKLTRDWDVDQLPKWGTSLPVMNTDGLNGLFDEVEKKEDDELKLVITLTDDLAESRDLIKAELEDALSMYNGIKVK